MSKTATAIIAQIFILIASVAAEANVEPLARSPKFLTLPFDDQDVIVRQGWYYDSSARSLSCPHPAGDVAGAVRHCGIDYFKGPPGERVTFQVLAAAKGRAKRFDGSYYAGTFVIIEHDEDSPGGGKFCTRYLHLNPDQGFRNIPSNVWVPVERGDPIGWAGSTGEGVVGIHLHFEVTLAGENCNPEVKPRFDPYDIAGNLIRTGVKPTKEYYPGNELSDGGLFAGCGPNFLWTECPPTVPSSSEPPPTATACTNVFTSRVDVPQGYGAAYNLFSSRRELVVQASCAGRRAEIAVGSGSSVQYIYREGYVFRNDEWQPIEFMGSQSEGAWYIGEASATVTRQEGRNYVVAYICTWTGSQWKCGCRDRTCATPYWQLQAFQ